MVPKLLFDIAKCDNFLKLITSNNKTHPCNKIIDFQRKQGASFKNDFYIPEPWSGDIIKAPILIISSNPAYSGVELYPNLSWPEPLIADFFINRFKNRGPDYSWVYNNKVLNTNKTRGNSVRYWSNIKRRVEEIINPPAKPGINYCITELVHCKSNAQFGVKNALPECTEKYFSSLIGISGAKIIIAFGSIVRNYFNQAQSINGIPVIYLPHPNDRRVRKTVNAHYTTDEIQELREILRNQNNRELNIIYSDIELPTEDDVREFIDNQINSYDE